MSNFSPRPRRDPMQRKAAESKIGWPLQSRYRLESATPDLHSPWYCGAAGGDGCHVAGSQTIRRSPLWHCRSSDLPFRTTAAAPDRAASHFISPSRSCVLCEHRAARQQRVGLRHTKRRVITGAELIYQTNLRARILSEVISNCREIQSCQPAPQVQASTSSVGSLYGHAKQGVTACDFHHS